MRSSSSQARKGCEVSAREEPRVSNRPSDKERSMRVIREERKRGWKRDRLVYPWRSGTPRGDTGGRREVCVSLGCTYDQPARALNPEINVVMHSRISVPGSHPTLSRPIPPPCQPPSLSPVFRRNSLDNAPSDFDSGILNCANDLRLEYLSR